MIRCLQALEPSLSVRACSWAGMLRRLSYGDLDEKEVRGGSAGGFAKSQWRIAFLRASGWSIRAYLLWMRAVREAFLFDRQHSPSWSRTLAAFLLLLCVAPADRWAPVVGFPDSADC